METIAETSQLVDTVILFASGCFREQGYTRTTLDDIAAKAEIDKKTLHALFPSKEAILREVVWRETMYITCKYCDEKSLNATPDLVFMSICRCIFTDRIKEGKEGIFWGLYSSDRYIKNYYFEAIKRVFKDVFDRGKKKGLFKPMESSFASDAVISIIAAALRNFTVSKTPLDMFDAALTMIADSVAYKNRINFDAMG